jgi:hypothetical protein
MRHDLSGFAEGIVTHIPYEAQFAESMQAFKAWKPPAGN